MLQRTGRATGFIEPCLPSPAKQPPTGADWLHEIKHDGFRIMARRDATGVRLCTRIGYSETHRANCGVVGKARTLYRAWSTRPFEGIVANPGSSLKTKRTACALLTVSLR